MAPAPVLVSDLPADNHEDPGELPPSSLVSATLLSDSGTRPEERLK